MDAAFFRGTIWSTLFGSERLWLRTLVLGMGLFLVLFLYGGNGVCGVRFFFRVPLWEV